jgi:ZIP family zinc transporter
VDGLLVGVGFAAGAEAGLIVTIALSLEVLFLVLATAAALVGAGASRGRVLGTTAGLTVLLLAGAIGGTLAAGALTGGLLAGVLAFGVAALLYLVTEELLVEAHETEDTPLATATFFLGFLALLLLEMAL